MKRSIDFGWRTTESNVIQDISLGKSLDELSKERAAGRPPKYRARFATLAKQAAYLGATDWEIAQMIGVNVLTISRWKTRHHEFCKALKAGKEAADDRVQSALYHRAVGYTYIDEKLFTHEGRVIRATRVVHLPPDVGAATLWLKNRRPDQWRERADSEGEDLGALLDDLKARSSSRL